MATIGAANDPQSFVIEVPDENSPAAPFSGLFTPMANSVLSALVRLKNQLQSQQTFTDKFTAVGTDWSIDSQVIHVYGETHAYIFLSLVAKVAISVPADGNLTNRVVGNLDPAFVAASQADLSAGSSGRLLSAYTLNDGSVKLSAIGGSANINVGDPITFGGYYPLANPVRSSI